MIGKNFNIFFICLIKYKKTKLVNRENLTKERLYNNG